ncbi:low-temperature-induced 65 kDa protein-like [Mangifera indica]|uniref:low-temperature-induced 65 kDa protein-like n=1 Tax=Mangifera indica TaxID=29780 RepID=UPI001CF998C1|nr:low-temperature-induced 65 kDa protein-like [Mangifera indica]
MDFQMAHAHGHGKAHEQEQEPHIVGDHTSGEGEDKHHQETKWVLKKVKAKARKIKDTLTKHGHNHNHDHDHIPDDHDLDEEEMVEDPEVHGAPIYEATAIKTIGVVDSRVNTEKSTVMEVDRRLPSLNPDEGADLENVDSVNDAVGKGNQRVNLGLTTVVGEIPAAPQNTPVSCTDPGIQHTRDDDPIRTFLYPEEELSGQPKVNLQRPKGLVEDPGAPRDTAGAYVPGNYQNKGSYHTGKGGEKAGVTPVIQSFDKMKIYDESKLNSGEKQSLYSGEKQSLPTGTGDFLTSLPTGSHDQFSPELSPPERKSTEDNPQENVLGRPSNQGSYTEKFSSATSAIADKAVSAKNAITSKLGYGEKHHRGNAQERGVEGQDKGISVKDYLAEKLKPGEEDRALSEVISEAFHTKEEEPDETDRPMRKVTGSEDVARRLGTHENDDSSKESNINSSFISNNSSTCGNGVVDKVKGAVGSWFRKGDESKGSQQ